MNKVLRSFRFRVFLIVWSLVVTSLAVLGLVLGNWSSEEFARLGDAVEGVQRLDRLTDDLIDSLRGVPGLDSVEMRRVAQRFTAREEERFGVIVVSPRDGMRFATITGLLSEEVSVGPGQVVRVAPRGLGHGALPGSPTRLEGRLLDPIDAHNPLLVVLVPKDLSRGITTSSEARATGKMLQRKLVAGVLAGSVIAAIVTLTLSGTLTGRVTALAEAAGALGRGNLSARVPVSGHDEVATLGRSFNLMASSLEASERQRQRMVSDIAHELRTPLTNLIGNVRMALDGLRPTDRDLIEVLDEEAGLLRRVVEDLQDLALADAGELLIRAEDVKAEEAVHRAAGSFDPRFRIRLACPVSCHVVADPQRLGQVLRNLIGNAIVHSPEPGTVAVAVGESDGLVTFTVSDRGPGIAAEHLEHIWDRFYRADPSRSRGTGGMGLGLAIARRLAEAMGGTLRVESVVGAGAHFMLTVPRGREMGMNGQDP